MSEDKMNQAWGPKAVAKVKSKSNAKSSYMKLVKGENKVRFLGHPVFTNILWTDAAGDKLQKYVVPDSYVTRMEALGYSITPNVILKVIDRNESAMQIQIIEKKDSVFSQVFKYSETIGEGLGSRKPSAYGSNIY